MRPYGRCRRPLARQADAAEAERGRETLGADPWSKLGFLTGCPLGRHLGAVSVDFGTILGFWGAACKTLGAACKTLGAACKTPGPACSFWGVLGVPSGTLSGSIFGSGCAREALASHFGPFLSVEGPHSVSTSQSDPRKGQKTAIFEVANVAEV